MKKTFLLFAILICSSAFAQSDSAFSDFRTGNFYAPEMPEVSIERTNEFQMERNAADGSWVKMSVTWTGDCTYELRYMDSNKKGEKKTWKKIQVLSINITSTTGNNSYSYTALSPAFQQPVRGTLIRKGK